MDKEKPFEMQSGKKRQEQRVSDLDETKALIKKMFKMRDDLNTKLDSVYHGSGLDPSKIRTFLNNPSNFNSEEWEKIQNERKMLWERIGLNFGDVKLENSETHLKKTEQEKKSRHISSRRNWIPIR